MQPEGDHRVVIAVPTAQRATEVFDFVRNELDNAGMSSVMTQQDAATTAQERASDHLLEALEEHVLPYLCELSALDPKADPIIGVVRDAIAAARPGGKP